MTGQRSLESLIVGVLGGLLAWGVGTLIGISWLPVTLATVGALNSLITGAMGMYTWHRAKGWLFFLLDSTWGLFGVALGLVLHIANTIKGSVGKKSAVSVTDMCRRTNRYVYEGGVGLRTGFALALGNVISNAGGTVGLRDESAKVAKRRQFVVAHEGVHVLQNRIFGPLYQLVYVGWMVLAALLGVIVWLVRDRKNLGQIIETMAYYNNPFEYWAYRNDDYWPPKGAHDRYAWGSGKDVV
jgi:hypothetical protein